MCSRTLYIRAQGKRAINEELAASCWQEGAWKMDMEGRISNLHCKCGPMKPQLGKITLFRLMSLKASLRWKRFSS